MKTESAAGSADVYIEGILVVEGKTDFSQWVEGFYQALHYHRRYGLAFNSIMVIAHRFCGIWKVHKLPEAACTFPLPSCRTCFGIYREDERDRTRNKFGLTVA